MIFVRCGFLKCLKCIDIQNDFTVENLTNHISVRTGINIEDLSVYNGLKQLSSETKIQDGSTVCVCLSLPGGKGGFGSMLRAIGAQIEKTTNREACRDLSGRRLRDINEEQRLRKWLEKKAEREKQSALRRKEKLERMKRLPKHEFDDAKYDQQRSELPDRIHDALSAGLKRKSAKSQNPGPSTSKKACLSMDLDVSISSDSNDEEVAVSNEDSSDSNPDGVQIESDSPEKEDDSNNQSDVTPVLPEDTDVPEESSMKADIAPSEPEPCEIPENKEYSKDLMTYNEPQELEKLGLDNLKMFLTTLGLKCGGTLTERVDRLWTVRGLEPENYPASVKAKLKKKA